MRPRPTKLSRPDARRTPCVARSTQSRAGDVRSRATLASLAGASRHRRRGGRAEAALEAHTPGAEAALRWRVPATLGYPFIMETAWVFADLDPRHVDLVREAERTLGADYVMAFRPAPRGGMTPPAPPPRFLPAVLDASRLDCLQGLEQQLDAVLVAYSER